MVPDCCTSSAMSALRRSRNSRRNCSFSANAMAVRSVVTDLKVVEAAARRVAKGAVARRPVLSSWSSVIDYCRTADAVRLDEPPRRRGENLGERAEALHQLLGEGL